MRLSTGSPRCQNVFSSFTYIRRPTSQFLLGLRFNQSRRYAFAYESPQKIKPKIGEEVLIFNAGVLRTTFVGLLKATTVVIFFGNLFFVVPKLFFYGNADQPSWLVPAVAVAGAVPMAYVLWSSAPFVVSACLKQVPFNARRSADHLFRWAEKLPYNSEIEFKTFKWNGFFQRTTVNLLELRTKKPRLGIENLVRLNAPEDQPSQFYVGTERKARTRKRLWETILRQIELFEAPKKA